MAKKKKFFDTFKGQSFYFHGNFQRSREALKKMVKQDGGTVPEKINDKLTYLVHGATSAKGPSSARKSMAKLNAAGASILEIDEDQFAKLLAPTEQELLDLIEAGKAGSERLNYLENYPRNIEFNIHFKKKRNW